MKKITVFLLITGFIIFAFYLVAAELEKITYGEQNDTALDTPTKTIQKALDYTGFERLGVSLSEYLEKVNVRLITGADTSSEYAKKVINNAPMWQVIFENVILDINDIPINVSQGRPKNFKILINSVSKSLLQIIGLNSASDIDINSDGILVEAAVPFKRFGEKYYGLPEKAPQIDFLAALDSSHCYAAAAEKITAVYVMYSYDRSLYKQYEGDTVEIIVPAWVIQLDGLPPWSTNGQQPEYTNQRVVINSITGKRITAFSYTVGH